MALTSFPTIVFNSSTGSDSAASGAGPATAITGTCAASTNSTTVTFNGTPDLTGVAQDGSHVLWVNGIGFVRISTVNTGAYTCVVETALTISASTAFAIGGKRATWNATESRRLFAATSSPTASGIAGGWTARNEDDGAGALTSALVLSATSGNSEIVVEGDSTTARRKVTQSGNARTFTANTANRWVFRNFQFHNSNGTKNEVFLASAAAIINVANCIIGDSGGTNVPKGLFIRTSATPVLTVENCSILRCTGNGINDGGTVVLHVTGCDISRNGGIGIQASGSATTIRDSIIAYNAGDGISVGASGNSVCLIEGNTIDGNTGDGIEFSGANLTRSQEVRNNQITNNGAYGINVSGSTPHCPTVAYNNFYGNTTAAANGITLDATNLTADPGYTDRTNTVRNYAVGTAMKAAGFPASSATIGAGQSGTTTYVDIGAAQRQESESGTRSY